MGFLRTIQRNLGAIWSAIAQKKEGKEKKERLPPFAAHSTSRHPPSKRERLAGKTNKTETLSPYYLCLALMWTGRLSWFHVLSTKSRRSRQNGFHRFPHLFFSSIGILRSSHNHPPITLTASCLLYTLKKPHNVKKVCVFDHYLVNWACGCFHGAQVRHRRSFCGKNQLGDWFFFQFPRGGEKKAKKVRKKSKKIEDVRLRKKNLDILKYWFGKTCRKWNGRPD